MKRRRRMELAARFITFGSLMLGGCANLRSTNPSAPGDLLPPPMMGSIDNPSVPVEATPDPRTRWANDNSEKDRHPVWSRDLELAQNAAAATAPLRIGIPGESETRLVSAQGVENPGLAQPAIVEVTPPLVVGYDDMMVPAAPVMYPGHPWKQGHLHALGRAVAGTASIPIEGARVLGGAAGSTAHAAGAAVGATADVAGGAAALAGNAVGSAAGAVAAPIAAAGRGLANYPENHRVNQQNKRMFASLGLKLPHKQAKTRRDIASNNPNFPRELRMASHPEYIVEPPDVLFIEALGLPAEREVYGERLVRQDGTISLGYFGQIHVAGLTIAEIEEKIYERLKQYVNNPLIYVDVAAFNSKVYYVLGQVQQTGRLPVTGKETVLDGLTLAGGPTPFAKIKGIHVARPNPGGGCDQILWVDYKAITECGDTRTNYQLLPGDRIVVPGTKGYLTSVFFDNFLTPVERLGGLFALFRLSTNNN